MAPTDKSLQEIIGFFKNQQATVPLDIIVYLAYEVTHKLCATQTQPLGAEEKDIYITEDAQVIVVPNEEIEVDNAIPSIGSMILDLMEIGEHDAEDAGYLELDEVVQKTRSGELDNLEDLKNKLKSIERAHFVNPNRVKKVQHWLKPLYQSQKAHSAQSVVSMAEAKRTLFIKNQKKIYKTNQVAKAIILTCFIAVAFNFFQIRQNKSERGIASVPRAQVDKFTNLLESKKFDQAEEVLLNTPSTSRDPDWYIHLEELVVAKVRDKLDKNKAHEIPEMILLYMGEYEDLAESERLNQILQANEE